MGRISIVALVAALAVVCDARVHKMNLDRAHTHKFQLIRQGKWTAEMRLNELRKRTMVDAVNSEPFIDYDDDLYLGSVSVGTPEQSFTVQLDTGSSNFWIVDKACSQSACKSIQDTFDTTASSTLKADKSNTFNVIYGSGYVQGFIGYDALNLAGFKYPQQGFGIADHISQEFTSFPGFDGILGLGWPALASKGITPPVQNLLDQFDQPIFTVWLDRHVAPSQGKLGGLITFGGLDNDNCDSSINYVSLSSQTYWQFPVSSVSIGTFSQNKAWQAISDTGTSWIGAPQNVVDAVNSQTGAKYAPLYGVYEVPCSGSYPDLVFTIGGIPYTIPSSEYVIDLELPNGNCALTFFSMQGGGFSPDYILGDTFIRTFCNVHDVGQARIGFSKAKHSEI